jgi:hypothetical protein
VDLNRVYSGPGSDKDRVWPNPNSKCHPAKEVPGSGQICVSEMFMPDPDTPSLNVPGPATLGKKFPDPAKSIYEMFMPNPDSPSLNVPDPHLCL